MHINPKLTPAAEERWTTIPHEAQTEILDAIWCSKCSTSVLITEATGELHASGDILINGLCATCKSPVCRVIETSETLGPPTTYP